MKGANTTITLGNGFYQSDSLPFSNQRCVNLYVNIPENDAVTPSSLFNTEGLTKVLSTGLKKREANRGAIEFQNKPYFVNGNFLYEVNQHVLPGGVIDYSETNLGRVGGGDGRVSMAENGTQILIINDAGEGFIYQPSAGPRFEAITDGGFYANGTPKKAIYVDRYFVVVTDEKKAIISAVGNGKSWNSLDTITAEADPDDLVAPFVHKNQLYLLGSTTTEQFQNIGGAGVPFRRVNGFVLDQGCSSADAVVNVGNSVFWLGRSKNEKAAVWQFSGGEPEKVSTTAIENKIHELTEEQLQRVFAYAYGQRGNRFVHFTTPFNTFVYNPKSGRWHECESEITNESGNRTTTPRRISSVVDAYNELFVGDLQDGRIGIIDEKTFMEYDEPFISYFTTQPLYDQSNSFTMPQIELFCENGIGNKLCQNPKVRLEISRDGVVFENPRTRELGTSGNRNTRQVWYKNGRVSRLCVLKFTVSDKVKRRFYSVELKVVQSL